MTKHTRKNEIWYCYQLNEKVNELGNPYIGKTNNLRHRANQWKIDLKLDYAPELYPIQIFDNEVDCYNFEQDKKVKDGWQKEVPLEQQRKMQILGNEAARKSEKQKKAASITGKKSAESGHLAKIRPIAREAKRLSERLKEHARQLTTKYLFTCPHCGRIFNGGNYAQYHGDKCKAKK